MRISDWSSDVCSSDLFRQSIRTQCQNQTIARHFVARQQIFHVLRKFTAAQLPARDIDDERQHRQSALACAQVMLTDMGDLPELEITDQAGPGASTQQFVFVDASEARMLPVQAGTDAAYRTVVQIQYRRQQQMELVEIGRAHV